MKRLEDSGPIGVLVSGGLDSSILVGLLLSHARNVQPLYIRTGVKWQDAELLALERYLNAIATPELAKRVVLDLPLADVYTGHWSFTGHEVPGGASPDEDVYLPGRNALLLVKAAVWCQLHGISELAMAPLGTSPFADASEAFFRDYQAAINHGGPTRLRLASPFGQMNKRQVMELGRDLPLALTFSCIAPQGGLHCGLCNKCAERKAAFADAALRDNTAYADQVIRT